MTPRRRWFDAHLDLACLAVCGRDMLAPLESCGGPHPPAAVTLGSLRDGGVVCALATIFTEAGGAGPEGYPPGDAEAAFRAGRTQLEVYLTWRDAGRLALDLPRALWADPHVGEIRGGMGVAEVVRPSPAARVASLGRDGRLHAGILIEGADPIRSPDDAAWWKERGVCAVGMAWWRSSRYAGGNGSSDGLTDAGRALVRALDAANIVHDASHLSDRSLDELFALTDRAVIASHSNCRALLGPAKDGGPNQRHIADEAVREIARRGGVVGVNLVGDFVRDDGAAPTIDDVVRHVERVCDLAGTRAAVGLGSDMDGGFSAEKMPVGVRTPRDLDKIADALAARGWTEAEVEGFACGNWARFWAGVADRR